MNVGVNGAASLDIWGDGLASLCRLPNAKASKSMNQSTIQSINKSMNQ